MVFVDALVIAVVTYAVTVSLAKVFAREHGYNISNDQVVLLSTYLCIRMYLASAVNIIYGKLVQRERVRSAGGRERGRKGEREGGKKEGSKEGGSGEGGRKEGEGRRGREGGREGGREEGRERGKEGGREE